MHSGLTTLLAASFLVPAVSAGASTLTFKAGCEPGRRITIAAVGDLLFHKKLQVQALRPTGRYLDFWRPVQGRLRGAHVTYGNLEGPAAHGLALGGKPARDPGRRYDNRVYQSSLKYLSFNFHPSVITDLVTSGFDVISTANNHAVDRGWRGIDRTIDALKAARLPFTGTRHSEHSNAPWHALTRAGGLTVAWLACTYSTNGYRAKKGQVLMCYKDRKRILALISGLAASSTIDAVILTPHWGVENSHTPARRQKSLARAAIEAGATAVLGAHPHVLQPWEKVRTKDGREGLVVYSMGNFISNQRKIMQRVGGIVFLELVKPAGGPAAISAAGHLPTWVVINAKGHRVHPAAAKAPRQALKRARRLWPSGNEVPQNGAMTLARACS